MSLGLSLGIMLMKFCCLQDTNFCSRDSPQSLYPLSDTYYREFHQKGSLNRSKDCADQHRADLPDSSLWKTYTVISIHNLISAPSLHGRTHV